MKKLFLYLVILIIAVLIGLRIQADPGYALFAYDHWSVEMPLWLAVIAILVAMLITYNLLRLLGSGRRSSKRIKRWLKRRKQYSARKMINRGLFELTVGHWQHAEKCLVNSAKYSTTPVVNYLAAARAAHEQGAYERRDDYLRKAHHSTEKAEVAVSLMQAQLQMSHRQYEQALATLNHLYHLMPQHTYVLRLLKRLYCELNEWQKLADLLPALRKNKIVKTQELIELEQKTYTALIDISRKQDGKQYLNTVWQNMPKKTRQDPILVAHYVRALLSKKVMDEAEKILQDTLKKVWDKELVRLYGLVEGNNVPKQLANAEAWLKQHGHDAMLFLTLGRLARRNKLWGKAKEYLVQSVELEANPRAFRELASLLESQDDIEQAFRYYRQGLQYV